MIVGTGLLLRLWQVVALIASAKLAAGAAKLVRRLGARTLLFGGLA
jgi:hypothetical protein